MRQHEIPAEIASLKAEIRRVVQLISTTDATNDRLRLENDRLKAELQAAYGVAKDDPERHLGRFNGQCPDLLAKAEAKNERLLRILNGTASEEDLAALTDGEMR
jgi:regulator of replication initiation timing